MSHGSTCTAMKMPSFTLLTLDARAKSFSDHSETPVLQTWCQPCVCIHNLQWQTQDVHAQVRTLRIPLDASEAVLSIWPCIGTFGAAELHAAHWLEGPMSAQMLLLCWWQCASLAELSPLARARIAVVLVRAAMALSAVWAVFVRMWALIWSLAV